LTSGLGASLAIRSWLIELPASSVTAHASKSPTGA
jgi:hypothetical protein